MSRKICQSHNILSNTRRYLLTIRKYGQIFKHIISARTKQLLRNGILLLRNGILLSRNGILLLRNSTLLLLMQLELDLDNTYTLYYMYAILCYIIFY